MMDMADCKITSPLSGWFGGKFLLAPRLIPLVPEHNTWIEVFAGAAWLTFRKKPSVCEVLNDRNSDIANLYRIIRDQPESLYRYARFALHCRSEFEYWQNYRGCDPVKRAWRQIYILKNSFAGRDCGRLEKASFGYDIVNAKKTTGRVNRIAEILAKAHARLAHATIECQDWRKILARYDSPGSFFYVDPPYYGYEEAYGRGLFARRDHATVYWVFIGLAWIDNILKYIGLICFSSPVKTIKGRLHLLVLWVYMKVSSCAKYGDTHWITGYNC